MNCIFNFYYSNPYEVLDEERNTQLLVVFQYYASYGDKNNIISLSSGKWKKILSDLEIIDKSTRALQNIDLIYSSLTHNTSKMDFPLFKTGIKNLSLLKTEDVLILLLYLGKWIY